MQKKYFNKDIIKLLIKYIIVEPKNDDYCICHKNPYISSEMTKSESPYVQDLFVLTNDEYMKNIKLRTFSRAKKKKLKDLMIIQKMKKKKKKKKRKNKKTKIKLVIMKRTKKKKKKKKKQKIMKLMRKLKKK